MLTGILRVAKESLFSGLNNLVAYSILSEPYSADFGFVEDEVRALVEAAGQPALLEPIRDTYNGYLFGGEHPTRIYNPWSVLSCIADRQHRLRPWWLMTSSDDLLRELMTRRGYGLSRDMEALLSGEAIEKPIEENIVLRDVEQRHDALWSFLLFAGYLKEETVLTDDDWLTMRARLSIPNREVRVIYRDVFLGWLQQGVRSSDELRYLHRALLEADAPLLEKVLSQILLRTLSYMDPIGREPEKLYHGLILGLLVSLEDEYEVRSNRESGYGRADVLIRPRQAGRPGVVLELKVLDPDETVEQALEGALTQVRERRYVAELEAAGASPVHALAAVFDGKRVRVARQGVQPGPT